MKPRKHTIDYVRTALDTGAELTFQVTANVYPGDPGRLSGPPEDCYPPEGPEVEFLQATLNGHPVDLDETFADEDFEAMEEQFLEEDEAYLDYDPREDENDFELGGRLSWENDDAQG